MKETETAPRDEPRISPFAGKKPEPSDLVDVAQLIRAYEVDRPDPSIPSQRVHFGTSGHRGSSLDISFNENHVLAITQAICMYRNENKISGPLFLGYDTHALSLPALNTALEVLAANGVIVMIGDDHEFTPTPVISHAILSYNKGRSAGLADGIIITPSHNPPREGGFKYNPPHGGPAENEITDWIQKRANGYLVDDLKSIKRVTLKHALGADTTHLYDFITPYVDDLSAVLDMDIIRSSKIKIGVDPLGGAGVHYWPRIADFYKINLTVLNTVVDPRFGFMTRDWDGQIRMDPSSEFAMRSLIENGSQYDISFACDTDHDRHGIVTKNSGLMPANHYLCVAVDYLFKHRPQWPRDLKVGKTLVSSQMIDRVTAAAGRELYEVPVGFKWFVDGLLHSQLAFAGEESAGATFLKKDGDVWTTDKDGFVPALLSAEMTARLGKDPTALYSKLTSSLGDPVYKRIEVPATEAQKLKIGKVTVAQVTQSELAGDPIVRRLTNADGNDAPIGGIKIETGNGWIAARPSGTEDIYKIYGESFVGEPHLETLLEDAKQIVAQISR